LFGDWYRIVAICDEVYPSCALSVLSTTGIFINLCDERDMVIRAEIVYISRHMSGGNENTLSRMHELIVQNYDPLPSVSGDLPARSRRTVPGIPI